MTLLHEYQGRTSYSREAIPPKDPCWRQAAAPYKSYAQAGARTVGLARLAALPPVDLWQTLRARRSRREYAADPIAQGTLFLLLWSAQGITGGDGWSFRTAPSAGALYPVETYLCAARVEGIEPGVWHWELPEQRLALVAPRADVAEVACHACVDQEMVAAAAVTFVWSAVWGRGGQKYGDRALRYAYLDVGHLAENLHLAATGLGLGACMIGAFFDDEMNALVGVDGQEETVIYAASVGRLTG